MWLQYSVGGISGALAGLTAFYLLKEIVIERERRSIILMLIYILIGMLGGLICSHLTVNIKESLLMIIFGFTLFMGATIDKYYLIMPDEGAVFLSHSWNKSDMVIGEFLFFLNCCKWQELY